MNHKNNYHKNSNKSMGKNKTMLSGHVPNKNDLVSFKFLFVNSFGVSIAQIWNSRITKL